MSDSIPLSGIIPYSLILTFIKLSKNLYMAAAILISIIFFIIKKRFAELISYLTLFLFTTVFIGTAETKVLRDKMVTPRGYDLTGGNA